MKNSDTDLKTGWVWVRIPERFEVQAKTTRLRRDAQYRNIYDEAETDERWVGELGEKTFESWLKKKDVKGFRWILEHAAGKPDFILPSGIRVGVKTVKRKGPRPYPSYTAQITAQHAAEPIDHFFFMSYHIHKRTMWLLGGIDQKNFLTKAKYYKDGEWVHKDYQVRGHDIYNIEMTRLTPPHQWLIDAGIE